MATGACRRHRGGSMKPILLLLSASLISASLLPAASVAQGQDVCSKNYGGCMDRCASRPSEVQAGCMNSCQSQSDECYQGVWGQAPADKGAVAVVHSPDVNASRATPAK